MPVSNESYSVPIAVSVRAVEIAPDDDSELPAGVTKGVWVGGAGDLAVVMVGGSSAVFVGIPPATEIRIAARRILETGTTASNILALY